MNRLKYSFGFLTKNLVILFSGSLILAAALIAGWDHSKAQVSDNAAAAIFRDFALAARRSSESPSAAAATNLEALARERKNIFEDLVRIDPSAAAANQISPADFERLPENVKQQVEKPVSVRGDLEVYVVDDRGTTTGSIAGSRIERFVRVGDTTYPAVVYGRRLTMTSKRDIPLHGVITDGVFLVNESPVREIASDEFSSRGVDAVRVASGAIAVEIGGEIHYFSDRAALNRFVSARIDAESAIGPTVKEGPSSASAVSPWTQGPKTVLLIRVDFSDAPGEPVDFMGQALTLPRAQSVFANEIGPFFATNSYGTTTLSASVTPVVRLPQTRAYYAQGSNFNVMLTDARAAARTVGMDTNSFDLDVVAFSYTSSIGWAGIAGVGFKGALVNGSFSLGTIAHELGHSYGLWHANVWRTSDGTVIGSGSNVEYGDVFDTMGMGASYGPGAHFNARYKRILEWIGDASVTNVASSGVYRVYAQDSAASSGIRALRIRKDDTRNYWIEYRQIFANNGATIRWDYASRNFSETQLLDMTPATAGTVADAALLIGQSFTDNQSGITVTILGRGNTTPESLDVRVDLINSTPVTTRTANDFDGDGKSDAAVFRPGSGQWWYLRSSDSSNRAVTFGLSTDTIVPGDFTGDGKADFAFWRPATGEWYVVRSEDNTFYGFPFGGLGDVPVPGDFDGDGKMDPAIYRPSNSTWYISLSAGGTRIESFGAAGDQPVVADYDGDGKADIAVFRPIGTAGSEWWLKTSSSGVRALAFGSPGDKAVPGDFTGDGKSDVAVWRPSTGFWYIVRSEDNSFYGFPFGTPADTPAPGDFDGDGKFDAAVVRPGSVSNWYMNGSTSGLRIVQFGTFGDRPVQSAYIP